MQTADGVANGIGKGVATALKRDCLAGVERLAAVLEIFCEKRRSEANVAGEVTGVTGRGENLVDEWREPVPMLLIGISIFLLGSALCGLAWNMETLIVFRGVQEIGYAYNKTSEGGVEYIAVKIDDPSLPYPIYASLFQNSKSDTLPLVWNRRKAK